MKTSQLSIIIIAASCTVLSCVKEDSYDVPISLGQNNSAKYDALLNALENGSKSLINIADLKMLYNAEPVEITSELVVKGYVSSSDRTGNFYKEFYIQDKPENPTAGLKVSLNMLDTYNFVNLGREVFIDLKGLYLGEINHGDGIVGLGGKAEGNEIVEMTEQMALEVIVRSVVTEPLVPVVLSISSVNQSHIGQYVSFVHVQFPITLEGQFFVNPADDYDTQRPLESCDQSTTFLIETSAFADFAQDQLPIDGSGRICGVITRDYYGENMVLVLNDKVDFVTDGFRCDPLFVDDFSNSNLSKWTTFSVSGDQTWGITNFGNPGPSAVMSGYSGGALINEDWLISQAIDMTSVSSGTLTFQTVKRYAGPDLELFMSTNYDGANPNMNNTWIPLSAVFDSNTGSWSSWTDSGEIDVSAAAGSQLYIAFKYTSTSSDASTFELDNVLIK